MNDTATILSACEDRMEPAYDDHAVASVATNGNRVVVVSDLHLSSGVRADGNFVGTENFLYDDAFDRFLAHLKKENGTTMLVINGDFIDYLRITRTPRTQEEFERWAAHLNDLGVDTTAAALRETIVPRERKYGLKTNDFKSVWKLACVETGHARFFDALAGWLKDGNRLYVVKGNHDLEWHWLLVRNYLRLMLARRIASTTISVESALQDVVVPNVRFAAHALLFDDSFYIEHGHKHDPFCKVLGAATLSDTNHKELNLPFGSFFNRYLLNRIEVEFPYWDNIRPKQALLPMLFRERFGLGLKVLFEHLPVALEFIRKGYWAYIFKRAAVFAVLILLPLGFIVWELSKMAPEIFHAFFAQGEGARSLEDVFRNRLSSVAFTILSAGGSYLLMRLAAYLQLSEQHSLAKHATTLLRKNSSYDVVIFGHTHNPERRTLCQGARYFNTGTWVPVVEKTSAEVRDDQSFVFVRRGEEGTSLMRWNDDAQREEPLRLIARKDEP
jgi:UDP-2,3-diacylglucosamine pyrophosphatase LpxH